jgi:lipopolysaccharide export system permease protein
LKKFDLYIIKKFFTTFVVTLSLFIIIIIIFDVSEKLDDFLKRNAPIDKIIFVYYLNYIPFFLNLFSPIFIFISVIFFTSKLASKSEIIATLAAGVTYNRIIRPYMIAAAFFAVLSFFLNAYIIPSSDKKRVAFENVYVRERHDKYVNNTHAQILPNTYFYMEFFGNDSTGSGVSLEVFDGNELKSKLFARRISWNRKNNKWRLEDYMVREYLPTGNHIVETGRYMDTLIPFNPDDFFRRNDDVMAFNINELSDFIEEEKLKGNENLHFYITEKYRRYAAPFSTFILAFIGVCVSTKKSRGGVGLNLGIGIFISFIYLFVIQYFNTYGNTGLMNPIIAVWIPNFIFAGVGFLLYRNAQK